MTTATLNFNLDDEDDNCYFNQCCRSRDLVLAFEEVLSHIRSTLKYDELSDEKYNAVSDIQDKIVLILNNYLIDIDKLIQ